MDKTILPYDPGVLPSKPQPTAGECIELEIEGMPPVKDFRQSIRNLQHPQHATFIELRRAAIFQMNGRAWSFGPVGMDLTVYSPQTINRMELNSYLGGVMDALDGSSGQTFTFLPIVFEDDSQLVMSQTKWVRADSCHFLLKINFLPDTT